MTDAIRMLELEIATLWVRDGGGLLVCERTSSAVRAPLVVVAETEHSRSVHLGVGLLEGLRPAVLAALDAAPPPPVCRSPAALDGALDLVRSQLGYGTIVGGPSWMFGHSVPPPRRIGAAVRVVEPSEEGMLAEALELEDASCPCAVIIRDGMVASRCVSARLTEDAAEAGVWTANAYRGRGYAAAVTAEWGRLIARCGKVAFYSAESANRASHAVARSLGLVHLGWLWKIVR
jgi:hypothetical protein